MDALQTDVETCTLLKRSRSSKMTMLMAAQNVLLTGCLFVTLYVYWTRDVPGVRDVCIKFSPINDVFGNATLEFLDVLHQNRMDLRDNSRISTECTGPYILHMFVCYRGVKGESHGSLQLQVAGKTDPLHTFELHTNYEACRGLQSEVYIRTEEEAVLRFYATEDFYIKNVTVGFNYLLGSRCEY